MGTYTDQQRLEDALGGVTKLILLTDKSGTSLQVPVMNAAISWAEETINSYAQKLPSFSSWATSPPQQARNVATDLTIWKLHVLTHRRISDAWQVNYDRAMEKLQMIGVDNTWDAASPAIVKTTGKVRFNGPNSTRGINEVRLSRFSDSAETDYL